MGHAAYRRKARRPLSNDIKFARIGVRTRELWLPEVGVSELFSCTLPAKIPQTGDAFGEPRVPRRSWSHYLSNGSRARGSTCCEQERLCARKAALPMSDFQRSWYRLESLALPILCLKVPDLRESELGLVRYGPASRVHRRVFWSRLRAVFRLRFRLEPRRILGDPRVPRRAWMCPLSNVPGLADQLVASQEDSVRKRATSVGEIPEISAQPLIFRPVFTRVVDVAPDVGFPTILVSPESLRYLLLTVQALHEGELGFARYDPANRRPSEVFLMPRGQLLAEIPA
uniref:Uncharacterized protein n=1 Tax=Fagus sylvatica TaxID=28930 RepID=A0A2N9IPF6_FAGSY